MFSPSRVKPDTKFNRPNQRSRKHRKSVLGIQNSNSNSSTDFSQTRKNGNPPFKATAPDKSLKKNLKSRSNNESASKLNLVIENQENVQESLTQTIASKPKTTPVPIIDNDNDMHQQQSNTDPASTVKNNDSIKTSADTNLDADACDNKNDDLSNLLLILKHEESLALASYPTDHLDAISDTQELQEFTELEDQSNSTLSGSTHFPINNLNTPPNSDEKEMSGYQDDSEYDSDYDDSDNDFDPPPPPSSDWNAHVTKATNDTHIHDIQLDNSADLQTLDIASDSQDSQDMHESPLTESVALCDKLNETSIDDENNGNQASSKKLSSVFSKIKQFAPSPQNIQKMKKSLNTNETKVKVTTTQRNVKQKAAAPAPVKLVKNPSWKLKAGSALETLIKLDPLSAQAREVYYSACLSLGIPKMDESCEFSVFRIPNPTLKSRFSVYSDLYSETCWTNVATLKNNGDSISDITAHGFNVNPETGKELISYISFQEDEPDSEYFHQFVVSEVAVGTSQFCNTDNEPWSIIYHSQQLPLSDEITHSSNSSTNPIGPRYRYRVFSSDQILPKYVVSFKYNAETMFNDSKKQEKSIMCDCCENEKATIHCKNDNVNLCDSCDASEHSTKITSRHTRISLSEKTRPINTQQYLCTICNIPVTMEDKMTGHHSRGISATHPLVSLSDAYSEAIKASNLIESDPLYIQFHNSITKLQGEIEHAKSSLSKKSKSIRLEIESLCTYALNELAAEVAEKENFISEREMEIARFRDQFTHMSKFIKFQQSSLQPIDFLHAWNQWNTHNAEVCHKQFSTLPDSLCISTEMLVKGTINVYSSANKHINEKNITSDSFNNVNTTDMKIGDANGDTDLNSQNNLEELTKQFNNLSRNISNEPNSKSEYDVGVGSGTESDLSDANIQRSCSILVDPSAPHSRESLGRIVKSIAVQEKIERLAADANNELASCTSGIHSNNHKHTGSLTKAGTLILGNTKVPSIRDLASDLHFDGSNNMTNSNNAQQLHGSKDSDSKHSSKSKKRSFFSRLLRKRSVSIGGPELLNNDAMGMGMNQPTTHALKTWNRPPSARGPRKSSDELFPVSSASSSSSGVNPSSGASTKNNNKKSWATRVRDENNVSSNRCKNKSPVLRKQLSMTPMEGSFDQNLDDVINMMNDSSLDWVEETPILISNASLIETPPSPAGSGVSSPIASRVFQSALYSKSPVSSTKPKLKETQSRPKDMSQLPLDYTPTRKYENGKTSRSAKSKNHGQSQQWQNIHMPGTPRPKKVTKYGDHGSKYLLGPRSIYPGTSGSIDSLESRGHGHGHGQDNNKDQRDEKSRRESLSFGYYTNGAISKPHQSSEGEKTRSLLKYAKHKHTQCKSKHISLKHRPFHISRLLSSTQGVVLYYHLPFSLWSPVNMPQRGQPKPILLYASWKHGKQLTSAFDQISSHTVGTMSRGPFIIIIRAESSIFGAYVSSIRRNVPQDSLKTITFTDNSSVPFLFRTASTKSSYTHSAAPDVGNGSKHTKSKAYTVNDVVERTKLQSKVRDFLFSISLDIRVDKNRDQLQLELERGKTQAQKKHRVSSLVKPSKNNSDLAGLEMPRLWDISPTEWDIGQGDIKITDDMKVFVNLGHSFGDSTTKLAFLNNESESKTVDSIEVYGFDLTW